VSRPLGVVHVVYGAADPSAIATKAKADGFEHLVARWDTPETVLPISGRYAMPPRPGCYAGPLGTWSWDETVAAFRAAPGALLEPHPFGCVDSDEAIAAVLEAVPGLRLVVDVAHVAYWGGDPLRFLDRADQVQLRQARVGVDQAPADDGDVDFAAVIGQLHDLDSSASLAIEYFDLDLRPEYRLDDPRAHALDLATHLRPLLD
jgi:sugar phosphate isomerase/epimerase